MKAYLALADGTFFQGLACGSHGEAAGEVVFNTSMSGYQEILTDPSYRGQMVAMTYPLIGNYGTNPADSESCRPQAEGLIVKECSKTASNFRSSLGLSDYLKENKIVAIEGIDTRRLTRHIRLAGAMKGVISTEEGNKEKLISKANEFRGLEGQDLVKEVTCAHSTEWNELPDNEKKYHVVVLDLGVKYNILRSLEKRHCKVTLMPASSSSETILGLQPHGVLASNGPGDPAGIPYAVQTVKELFGKVPLFGICMGQHMITMAMGGSMYKLKFGHHGGNHPVKDLATGKVSISVQNHGFCCDISSLPEKDVEITHINLNDQTLEGIRHRTLPVFAVQFHPEAGPGPHDTGYLFDNFIELMKTNRK